MVAVGFNPRTTSPNIRPSRSDDGKRVSRRYATKGVGTTGNRGLKPTATVITSLRDEWQVPANGERPAGSINTKFSRTKPLSRRLEGVRANPSCRIYFTSNRSACRSVTGPKSPDSTSGSPFFQSFQELNV